MVLLATRSPGNLRDQRLRDRLTQVLGDHHRPWHAPSGPPTCVSLPFSSRHAPSPPSQPPIILVASFLIFSVVIFLLHFLVLVAHVILLLAIVATRPAIVIAILVAALPLFCQLGKWSDRLRLDPRCSPVDAEKAPVGSGH